MAPDPSTPLPSHNQALLVGALDRQLAAGRSQVAASRRNPFGGWEDEILLQLPSPLGYAFGLRLTITDDVEGRGLLSHIAPEERVAVAGRLSWRQQPDRRYSGEAALSHPADLTLLVESIRPAEPQLAPGSAITIAGAVASPSRLVRHPQRPSVLLAATVIEVSVMLQRAGTRIRLGERERVPVAVPLDHPDAPNLLRPGNHVWIEGMLDRFAVPLSGPEVQAAQAALDVEWQRERAQLAGEAEQIAGDRRHQRRRRQLAEGQRSRVIAGYIELCAGAPATPREAQALRRADQQRGRTRPAAAGV